MICPKCNAENIMGSTFCIKCGTNIKEYQQQNSNLNNGTSIPNENLINQSINTQPVSTPIVEHSTQQNNFEQPVQQFTQYVASQSQQNISNITLNYLMYIIAILLKPFKSFKEEESKLLNTKTSFIFTIVVSVSMMLVTLVKTIITTIFTKSLDYSTYKMKTSIDFSNLKDIDWLSLIVKNLLIYICIIFAIAIVYYLASLVFKKTVNFIKLLSISATSIIPFVVLNMIVSPLVGKIWVPLAIVAMVIGTVYSVLIFINLINDSINFDSNDKKIYFHLICLSILEVGGYYAYMKLFMDGLGSQVSNILNMFN